MVREGGAPGRRGGGGRAATLLEAAGAGEAERRAVPDVNVCRESVFFSGGTIRWPRYVVRGAPLPIPVYSIGCSTPELDHQRLAQARTQRRHVVHHL